MNEKIREKIDVMIRPFENTKIHDINIYHLSKDLENLVREEKNKLLDLLASKFPAVSINFKAFKE